MMAARPEIASSYPPEGLSRNEAARYVGVGATTFDGLVRAGEMPKPRRFRGAKRLVWLKRELDRALEELPVDGDAHSDEYAGVRI